MFLCKTRALLRGSGSTELLQVPLMMLAQTACSCFFCGFLLPWYPERRRCWGHSSHPTDTGSWGGKATFSSVNLARREFCKICYVCKNRNNSECWLSSKEQLCFQGGLGNADVHLLWLLGRVFLSVPPAPQLLSLVVMSSGQSPSRQPRGRLLSCKLRAESLERSGWVLTINSVLKAAELSERKLSGDQN